MTTVMNKECIGKYELSLMPQHIYIHPKYSDKVSQRVTCIFFIAFYVLLFMD